MSNTVTQFYDGLADEYRFIFADWRESVMRQADALHPLIESLGGGQTLLDCTCGIGTQAIGLAAKGYVVHGTDLSSQAIERAKTYAPQFEATITPTFAVADLLHPPENPQQYDIVISCDNAVAHFMKVDDLSKAVDTMLMQLKPGGLLLISLRDYDALVQQPPRSTLPRVSDQEDRRHIVFQVWDWADDGRSYGLQMFTLHEQENGSWQTRCHTSHLRALQRAELESVLKSKPVTDIQWHMPEDSHYYQPIITAKKEEQKA